MAYEHKAGSFSLFKNKEKKSDSSPDYTGNGKSLDGSAIEVAAWLKGEEPQFLSCTMKPAQARASSKPAKETQDDDDSPF